MIDQKGENSVSNTDKNQNFTDNIFKELSGNIDFGKKEVEDNEQNKKDKWYYMSLSSNILSIVNIFLVFFIVGFYFYFSVQKDSSYQNSSLIDPFCFLVLGGNRENIDSGEYCYSVAGLTQKFNSKISELKNTIVLGKDKNKGLDNIFYDLYNVENFKSSKEGEFLISNKLNKLKVIDILNDFDKMKDDFLGGSVGDIKCKDIKITGDGELTTTCETFSSTWQIPDERESIGIIGSSGEIGKKDDLIGGTSITLAASFLNFIEKNPNYNFELINKQKVFSSEFAGEGAYVKKTKIDLKLKYNNLKNNLSL
ncbi:hypothetical protein H3C61_02750 [Candidatus Gracilibacteria bacterium]|nr:hypothetical protein [Candidatus Gracilibacteria bacterium]